MNAFRRLPPPSDTADKFMLRLPDGMRDRIKVAADAANRSMNAEIVATLEDKYPPPPEEDEALLFAMVDKVFERYKTGDKKKDEEIRRIVGNEFFSIAQKLMQSNRMSDELVRSLTKELRENLAETIKSMSDGQSSS